MILGFCSFRPWYRGYFLLVFNKWGVKRKRKAQLTICIFQIFFDCSIDCKWFTIVKQFTIVIALSCVVQTNICNDFDIWLFPMTDHSKTDSDRTDMYGARVKGLTSSCPLSWNKLNKVNLARYRKYNSKYVPYCNCILNCCNYKIMQKVIQKLKWDDTSIRKYKSWSALWFHVKLYEAIWIEYYTDFL